VRVHAVVTLRELLEAWRHRGALTDAQYGEVNAFLSGDETENEKG